jgi:hypothetical protein
MLHYFVWNLKIVGKEKFLVNSSFWIQVLYSWEKSEGEYFIYPYFDDQKKTFWYFAFDTILDSRLLPASVSVPSSFW